MSSLYIRVRGTGNRIESEMKCDISAIRLCTVHFGSAVRRPSKIIRKICRFFFCNKTAREKKEFKKQVEIIRQSELFDGQWYLSAYWDLAGMKMSPAEHYLVLGWKEGRDPSKHFKTQEYLILNSDVREKGICPLLHYERNGKYEERRYRLDGTKELAKYKPSVEEIAEFERKRDEEEAPERKKYRNMKVVPNKIVFKTFQGKYTCNPKYICNELIRQGVNCDIVWLYKPEAEKAEEFPKEVRLVPMDSGQAKEELATAKIIIDNGSTTFNRKLDKKPEQVSICTWHGSLGFKKLGEETVKNKSGFTTIALYRRNHDMVISNSDFENRIYRTSYWPSAEVLKYGHARNDILLNGDKGFAEKIRNKVCKALAVPPDTKLVLYAPTFREEMVQNTTSYVPQEIFDRGSYDICYERAASAFAHRFGGKWVILARHHFVNSANRILKGMLPEGVIDATGYPDIQELMVAVDAGITDYSSWILDFMLTRKPGFLFAVDADDYETARGMYYPLRTAPFPVAVNSQELISNIETFCQEEYESRVNRFLKEKGCVEDGQASRRVVEKLKEIMF